MNYKSRRRSLSRDSYRRYSSDDRSLSRSRSPRRGRRSESRSKLSHSRSRRHERNEKRKHSRSFSLESHSRDTKRSNSATADTNNQENENLDETKQTSLTAPPRTRARNMAWKLPSLNHSNKSNSSYTPRPNSSRRYKYYNRFEYASNPTNATGVSYGSDEFRASKEKMGRFPKDKEMYDKENQKLLSDYTNELNTLVGNLSKLSKDSEEYKESTEKIQSLKKAMKDLIYEEKPKFKPNHKTSFESIKLDNRTTKVFFPSLPEVARGKGNLAKWISENSKFLLPKQIAMLASQGTSHEAAVIQYETHEVAQKVIDSCKLHGIEATWLQSPELETSKTEENTSTTEHTSEVNGTHHT